MTQEFYALGRDRSAAAVRRFLNHFLPDREPCSSEFPVPESSDVPTRVVTSEAEILAYLEHNPGEPYGLYWSDTGTAAQAMVFYNTDGSVVFGLAVVTSDPGRKLGELASFVGASYSMLGSEQRPPATVEEFISLGTRGESGVV